MFVKYYIANRSYLIKSETKRPGGREILFSVSVLVKKKNKYEDVVILFARHAKGEFYLH